MPVGSHGHAPLPPGRWSPFSKSGVVGNPTLATQQKGEKVFQAVVEALVDLVREFKIYARGVRQEMHL
jgi:creatinine amidohydrolase/Fe(II)-dependent formamide hydrolase-like protein